MKLFEDLPSTNGPITAEMLNQIQDNLVVVSATEPTGDNREKVWIQKRKNLFDKNNYYISNDKEIGFNLDLETGKTYTLSANKPLYIAKFAESGGQNDGTQGPQIWESFTSWTFVAEGNTVGKFWNRVFLGVTPGTLSTNINDFDTYNIQIEEGSTATSYEEYVEPKIYVKNDNGIYEKFISKEDTLEKYSTEERRIGTWIDGKPIYRKVYRDLELTKGRGIVLVYNVADIDKVISLKGMVFHNIYGGQWKPANFYFSDNDFLSILYDAAKNIVMDNIATEGTITITIEYTKTTD